MPISTSSLRRDLDRELDVHAERLQHVDAAGPAGGRAVAVLGDRHARARHHEGGRRRDVEGVRAVAAGAAGVDGARIRTGKLRARARSGARRRHDLGDGLALGAQRHQQRRATGSSDPPPSMISPKAASSSAGRHLAALARGRDRRSQAHAAAPRAAASRGSARAAACRRGSGSTRDGTGRPRSAARGGERP